MAKKTKKAKYTIEKVNLDIEMTGVDSSQIESVGHLPEVKSTERRLFIKFHSGGIYEYRNVPVSLVQELLMHESPGGCFSSNIKGKFDYKKVG